MNGSNFKIDGLSVCRTVNTGVLAVLAMLAGCAVGPNYNRPAAPVPATWEVQVPWRESAPKDLLPKGEWWAVFHNDELSSLEKQALDAA